MDKYKEKFIKIKRELDNLNNEKDLFLSTLIIDQDKNDDVKTIKIKNVEEALKLKEFDKSIQDKIKELNKYNKENMICYSEEKFLLSFLDFIKENQDTNLDNVQLVKKHTNNYGLFHISIMEIMDYIHAKMDLNKNILMDIEMDLFEINQRKHTNYFDKRTENKNL